MKERNVITQGGPGIRGAQRNVNKETGYFLLEPFANIKRK